MDTVTHLIQDVRLEILTAERARELADVLIGMTTDDDWDDWTPEHLLADRPEKWRRSLIAYAGDRPVGWAIVSRTPSSVHLHHLVVTPAMRGHRVGEALVRTVIERNRDVGRVTLKVHPSNERAVRFYRRLGFIQTDISPSGYLQFLYITDPVTK